MEFFFKKKKYFNFYKFVICLFLVFNHSPHGSSKALQHLYIYPFTKKFTLYLFTIRVLTHCHSMLHFNTLKINSYGKHCEKRRNCLKQAISPVLTIFSIHYGTYFPFQMHFKMLSAIRFNLDQSKILLFGKGLMTTIKAFEDIVGKRVKSTENFVVC